MTSSQTSRADAFGDAGAYPSLDPGVVTAALQAGIPHSNLQEMQKLMSQVGGKQTKLKDLNVRINPDPLSEAEAGEDSGLEVEGEEAVGSGLAPDATAATLSRLAQIVELLADDKVKKANALKLDIALDGAATGSSEVSIQGTGKKAAAARRVLRSTYEEKPEEISALIERLMFEDLNSVTLGPGMTVKAMSARAWVEHRSKIGSWKGAAYSAWCTAGILDSLLQGDVKKARARAAVHLLMLDQSACDKGNWTMAGELSLEGPPPFTALATHIAPSVESGELPFSRPLDSRWAELALAHLKETDDYLLKRRSVGKAQKGAKEGQEDSQEGDGRRRAKAKAKAKSSAAGAASDP